MKMALGYLALAIVLAVTLNARLRWIRVAGTLIAAFGLFMMTFSIILADLDGTFAAVSPTAPLVHRITPAVLNVQAVIATGAILFLLWSAWMQARRPVTAPLPLRNEEKQFGKASRGFHWVIAAMMFCLVPIGLFMAILPEAAPERGDFVSAHQSLGLTVLLLTAGRISWLVFNPPPQPLSQQGTAGHRLARIVHTAIYGTLLAFPITGFLISQGGNIDLYGWSVPTPEWPAASALAMALHAWGLPVLFYATIAMHLVAVFKRHFADRDKAAVRRMLR
jgi:cytochrome b561